MPPQFCIAASEAMGARALTPYEPYVQLRKKARVVVHDDTRFQNRLFLKSAA
jgi:hypothetical protein